MREFEAEFALATSGSPRVVLIDGLPGIGKSALVRAFLKRIGSPLVLQASGEEAERELAFGVVNQLVSSAIKVGMALDTDADEGREPVAVGARLLRLLGDLQARGAAVVALDDAQWADLPSLHALGFALRRLYADHVLAVIVAREARLDVPNALQRLAEERGRVIHLGGLGADELAELAVHMGAGRLPRRALERLQLHTEGSPLHARGLFEELSPDVLRSATRPLPAPRSFGLLVVSRLAACSDPARQLVEAAAVFGPRVDLGQLLEVANVEETGTALDEANEAFLLKLQENAAAHFVEFPHSMVRSAVYDNLGPGRRAELHTRWGEVVDDWRLSLHHLAAGSLVSDIRLSNQLASLAADEIVDGDLVAAGRDLLLAARLNPERDRRSRQQLDAAELLISGGEVEEASRLVSHFTELRGSSRYAYVTGHLALLQGRQAEAERLLVAAWQNADAVVDGELRIQASEQLAHLYAMQVRPDEVIAWARRAVEGGETRAGASALTMLVIYLALAGRPGEALPLVEHLPKDPEHPSPRDAAGILGRGVVRLWIGDLSGARADLLAVLDMSRHNVGSQTGLASLGFLAQVEFFRGRWAESVRHSELGIAIADDSGQSWLLPLLYATLSWPLGARGEWDEAEANVKAAKERAAQLGDALSIGFADDAEVRLASTRRQHQRVIQAADRLRVQPGRSVVHEPGVFTWREHYAEALVGVGRLDDAAQVISEMEDALASRPRRRLAWAKAARLRGTLDAARTKDVEARQAFESSLSYSELRAAPFECALVEDAYGRFLRRVGERRAAAARLRSARDTFATLGARPFVERGEQELAACGLRRADRTPAFRVQLTPQELAVAELVADGRTNREVSEMLTLSVKTVEFHLANVFAKLGIKSRRQLRAHIPGDLGR